MPSQTTRITCLYHTPDWVVDLPHLPSASSCAITLLAVPFQFHSQITSHSACFLNTGISLSSLLNPLLLLCVQCLSDFINTNGFNYLVCAHGSQVVSWLHSHTSNCLQESTVWMSLGHYKLRMPMMNSPSFFQPLPPPPKFSVSMKGRASTQKFKVKNLEIVVHWNISLSCQIHLFTSLSIQSFA